MTSILLTCLIFSVNIYPQNVFFDPYTIIPPLGNIKSIAASTLDIFAVSDNNLLVFDKNNLSLKRTYVFDSPINLIAYDQWFDDVWITGTNEIIRLSLGSGISRQYQINEHINAVGIALDYIYLDAGIKYQLNRTTGETKLMGTFPNGIKWYRSTSENDIRKYPMLNPYYYSDDLEESQLPFFQYPVTSLCDDGIILYVGTQGYGLLRYNKVSWQKERVIYGPLDRRVRKVQKFGDDQYFISPSGISIYTGTSGWRYLRMLGDISNLVTIGDKLMVSIGNRLSYLSGTMLFPIADFDNSVLAVSTDGNNIYIGTAYGMFRVLDGSNEPFEFGPDKYPVNAVYVTEKNVYVGGEVAFYRYEKRTMTWSKVINRGIKDIVEINNEFYLLSTDNQLIKYRDGASDSLSNDTNWVLLPYFNVYDIDTDHEVLYCASYAGVAYYDPKDQLYKVMYNLPRIKFNYVFVADSDLIAVSDQGIYRLPVKYRD